MEPQVYQLVPQRIQPYIHLYQMRYHILPAYTNLYHSLYQLLPPLIQACTVLHHSFCQPIRAHSPALTGLCAILQAYTTRIGKGKVDGELALVWHEA